MAGHRTACVPAHISQVSQIGPKQISRKIVSREPDQRHPRWADFANGVQGITVISRKIALLGVMSAKLAKWVAKKWGPTCDRDISDSAIYTTAIYRAYTVLLNSLWPSDVIWRQGSRSTLAQVMACCLIAPSHYLNQCWLMISEVLWHSPDSNFTENTKIFIIEMSLKFTNLRL